MKKHWLLACITLAACAGDTADDDHSTQLNDAGELDTPTFWVCTCAYREPIFENNRYTGRDVIKQFTFIPDACSTTPPIRAAECVAQPDVEGAYRKHEDPCTSCEPLSQKEADEIAHAGGYPLCVEENLLDEHQGFCL
jgi:hypothetical protein